jgi:hypothetical protein
MGDNESEKNESKKNILDKVADGASFTSKVVQGASTAMGAVAEVSAALVPFKNFLPLIKEIGAVFDEIIELVEAAEHNKRTCKMLKSLVHDAGLSVQQLKEDRENKKYFFNKQNYSCLQELSIVIVRIKNFVSEISQANSFMRIFKAKNVEKTYKELIGEFESYIKLLSFSIDIKIANDLEQLKADKDDFNKVRLKIGFYYTFI